MTFNHTLDSREDAAIRQAHDLPSGTSSNSLMAGAVTFAGPTASGGVLWCLQGVMVSRPWDHIILASS